MNSRHVAAQGGLEAREIAESGERAGEDAIARQPVQFSSDQGSFDHPAAAFHFDEERADFGNVAFEATIEDCVGVGGKRGMNDVHGKIGCVSLPALSFLGSQTGGMIRGFLLHIGDPGPTEYSGGGEALTYDRMQKPHGLVSHVITAPGGFRRDCTPPL